MTSTKAADGVREHASPYFGGTGDVAVLLCHGFTGSPWSLRGWAEHLEGEARRVSVPLLPGHGTELTELNRTEWTDWYGCVEREFRNLAAESRQVFVAGLSMGGSLALRLAQRHEVAGLILVNPMVAQKDPRLVALPVLKHAVQALPFPADDIAKPGVSEYGYGRLPLKALSSMFEMFADVRAGMAKVTAPLLLFKSRVDHVVDETSVPVILSGVSSTDVERRFLERSHHVATLDWDAPEIFTASAEFVRGRSGR